MTKLYRYSPGDKLPPVLKPDGSWAHCTVLDIVAREDGFFLIHELGATQFSSMSEEVAFPVRTGEDGLKRIHNNWCLTEVHPTPEQLAVGDIVPPHDCTFDPRNTEPDWADIPQEERLEMLKMFWGMVQGDRSYQSILRISSGPMWTMAAIHTEQYTYDATIGQPFKMPWVARVSLPKRLAPPVDSYPRTGNYRHRMTGNVVQFAIHHAGKGRYPSSIPAYSLEGEGLMLPPLRKDFPKTRESTTPYVDEWGWWDLVSGERHPTDPRT